MLPRDAKPKTRDIDFHKPITTRAMEMLFAAADMEASSVEWVLDHGRIEHRGLT